MADLAPQIAVDVLGQSVLISKNKDIGTLRLQDVRQLLQEQLDMPGRLFEIFDSCGNQIRTDDNLRESIRDKRFPYTGLLADTSVHFLEAKQQALQQMQFKMLHESSQTFSSGTYPSSSINTLPVNGAALLDSQKVMSMDLPNGHSQAGLRESDQQLRNDIMKLQDRLNSREAADSELAILVNSLREAIDSSSRSSSTLVIQQDTLRTRLDTESAQRVVVETQLAQEVQNLTARVDELSEAFRSVKNDCLKSFSPASNFASDRSSDVSTIDESQLRILQKQFSEQQRAVSAAIDNVTARMDRCAVDVQQIRQDESSFQQLRLLQSELAQVKDLHTHTAEKLRHNTDQVLGEANYRFELFNECCASLHTKCLEQQQAVNKSVAQLNEKLEGVTKSVEDVLASDKLKEEFSFYQRLQDLEKTCVRAEQNVRDAHEADRIQREAEMKNWREALLSNHKERSVSAERQPAPASKNNRRDRNSLTPSEASTGSPDQTVARVQQALKDRGQKISRMMDQEALGREQSHGSGGKESSQKDPVHLLWESEAPASNTQLSDIGSEQKLKLFVQRDAATQPKAQLLTKDQNSDRGAVGLFIPVEAARGLSVAAGNNSAAAPAPNRFAVVQPVHQLNVRSDFSPMRDVRNLIPTRQRVGGRPASPMRNPSKDSPRSSSPMRNSKPRSLTPQPNMQPNMQRQRPAWTAVSQGAEGIRLVPTKVAPGSQSSLTALNQTS